MTEPAHDHERDPDVGRDVRRLDGWAVLATAAEMAGRGEEFALATVVWRQAPSSGKLGSRAIITADGRVHGWIGGACAEPVVIREAQRVIRDREPALLLLGTPEQFGAELQGPGVPHGMTVIPISCQSEGAVEVYVEPVVPTIRLTVVGRSPMAHTLADLAAALDWDAEVVDAGDFTGDGLDARSVVVVATQGHGDEEALERAVAAQPAFVGLVASQKRGEAVVGYLADRGVSRHGLDRVRVPVGLDLGHTAHREIAVSILAELVQLRASGALGPAASTLGERPGMLPLVEPATAIDPVCGMTVNADAGSHPLELDGTTYWFCCVGCHDRFAAEPARYLSPAPTDNPIDQEA
jgi:xanthine dehydrogenase accessory factor